LKIKRIKIKIKIKNIKILFQFVFKETTICREIGLCLWSEQDDLEIDEALKYDVIALPNDKAFSRKSERLVGLDDVNFNEIPSCVIGEFVMTKLEIELKDKTEQEQIKRSIEKVCRIMPRTVSQK